MDLTEAGNQPMHNEDETIWLVCNGEIYNYASLRDRLERLGHCFLSHSDNEAIIHAYEQWGEDFLSELESMFAFALWDEKKRKLIAARDRVGIKPLYYFSFGDKLAVASSAGALLHLLEGRPEPEAMSIAYVLTLGYIPSPWTVWEGISKLEPGHFLVWQEVKGIRIRKYWEPPREIRMNADLDIEQWRALFEQVLNEHLLSDVPVGLFLSGGLDSSSIAASLQEMGRRLKVLTVCFPDADSDELPVAEDTARYLGLPHQRIPLELLDVNSLGKLVGRAYDEPQGYGAPLTMYQISRAAAREFKVVLAGDGGDEVFGGYLWYLNLNGKQNFRVRLRRKMLRTLLKRNASPTSYRRAAEAFADSSPLHRHAWRLFPRFLPEEAEILLAPMGPRFKDEDMLAPLEKHYEGKLPLKRALQRVDLMTFCSDSILAKVDRASMAHSLEVRVPFLDRRVIERYLTAPMQPREATVNKPLLRDYLRPRVPPGVLSAPKKGFSLGTMGCFDWDSALEVIRQGPWIKEGYWNSNWENLVQPGVPNREGRIWTLWMLTRWAAEWLNSRK